MAAMVIDDGYCQLLLSCTIDYQAVITTGANLYAKNSQILSEHRFMRKEGLFLYFLRKHEATLPFVTTRILLTSTTCYGTTPAIRFRDWASASMRQAFRSMYSCARTRIVPRPPRTRLVSGMVQSVLLELVTCAERTKGEINQEKNNKQ